LKEITSHKNGISSASRLGNTGGYKYISCNLAAKSYFRQKESFQIRLAPAHRAGWCMYYSTRQTDWLRSHTAITLTIIFIFATLNHRRY